MHTQLYWIDGPWRGRLAVAARPRGGDWLEDEIKSWRRAGIDVVVSLLTPEEMEDLDLMREARCSQANGILFVSFPIVDSSVPTSDAEAIQLMDQLDRDLGDGKNIVVHCRQGIGRSGLIAASLLIARGFTPAIAIERVSAARHIPIPETPEQSAWIASFASTLSTVRQ